MGYLIKRKASDGLLELIGLDTMHLREPDVPEDAYPPDLRKVKVGDYYNARYEPAKKPRGFDKWPWERQRKWLDRLNKRRQRIAKAWLAKQPAEALRVELRFQTASNIKTLASRVRLLRPADQRRFDSIEAAIKRLQKRRADLIGAAWKRGKVTKAQGLATAIRTEQGRAKRQSRKPLPRHSYGGVVTLDHHDEFMPAEQAALNQKREAERQERARIKAEAERAKYEAERKARAKRQARLSASHAKTKHDKTREAECPECIELGRQERQAQYEAERLAREAAYTMTAERLAGDGPEAETNATCDDCGERIFVDWDTVECSECGSSEGYTPDANEAVAA
jgi:hypothetical protein